ncbi:MAG TPA: aminotransferase class V-fold PLP-dependent enzyme [Acidobacteriota bacterium]|jgi:selenocysteine lyase/cysteine desulfurase
MFSARQKEKIGAPQIDEIRRCFPVTENFVYFNHAAVSPLPVDVSNAITRLVEEVQNQGAYRWFEWEKMYAETRRLAAELIGAQSDEISLLKNTSEGVSVVASGLPWEEGDRVLVPRVEFPSNVYPWLQLQDRGVAVDFVPENAGRIPIDEIESRITSRTRLLAISYVQFLSGFRCNLEALGELCRARNIYFFVDAIQGAGVFPLDVGAAKIDFLSGDGHKWLMGPEGCAIFYCRSGLRDRLRPPVVGWRSVKDRADFLDYKLEYIEDGTRFEAGTPNTPGVAGLRAALQFIRRWSRELIERRVLQITDYLVEKLRSRGLEVLSPRDFDSEKSGIVSFRWSGNPNTLWRSLWEKRIVVASREGWVRVSPHFYNSEEEIDRFLSELK